MQCPSVRIFFLICFDRRRARNLVSVPVGSVGDGHLRLTIGIIWVNNYILGQGWREIGYWVTAGVWTYHIQNFSLKWSHFLFSPFCVCQLQSRCYEPWWWEVDRIQCSGKPISLTQKTLSMDKCTHSFLAVFLHFSHWEFTFGTFPGATMGC